MLEYVDAWVERTEANGGLTPSNIGLDGTIGGECDGKWYGGVYGWGFSVFDPGTGKIAHRGYTNRYHYGFGNALMLTGDQRYVDTWRGVVDKVNENHMEIDGRTMYPRMHGDEGWYDFRPEPFSSGTLELYYWSMDPSDAKRVPHNEWVEFLHGKRPDHPVEALRQDFSSLRSKVEEMHNDDMTPDTRMSDDPNKINPAAVENLTQLMLGGLPTGRVGYPLHCRLRYFDPSRRRAGIPEDVAALVDRMTDGEVAVTLVNVNQIEGRTVVVQGGAYAEHQLISATAEGSTLPVDGSHFAVRLAPGAGSRISIRMRRYANPPTLAFPWA